LFHHINKEEPRNKIIKDRRKQIMYFRYLLIAVLLACVYGYEMPDDNVKRQDNQCACEDGRIGYIYFDGYCPPPLIYCGPFTIGACCFLSYGY